MRSQSSSPLPMILLFLVACLTTAAAVAAAVNLIESRQQTVRLRQEREALQNRQGELDKTTEFLRERLGYSSLLNLEGLRQAVLDDLSRFGGEAGADYRSILEYQARQLGLERRRADAQTEHVAKLQAELRQLQPAFQKQVEVTRQALDERSRELLDVQKQHGENVRTLEQQVAMLLDRLELLTTSLTAAYQDRDQTKETSRKKIRQLVAAIRVYRAEKENQVNPATDPPDGEILHVDWSTKLATLNVGRQRGVRPGTRFTIHHRDAVSGKAGAKVGVVEMLRVGDDSSQGRIIESILKDPILPGDLAFNPILRDQRIETFALVGPLDIDGDGKDDTLALRRLIEQQGGRAVSLLDEKGKFTTQLAPLVKYVVMDPPAENSRKDRVQIHAQVVEQARENGIPVLTGRRFADMLGHVPAGKRPAVSAAGATPR